MTNFTVRIEDAGLTNAELMKKFGINKQQAKQLRADIRKHEGSLRERGIQEFVYPIESIHSQSGGAPMQAVSSQQSTSPSIYPPFIVPSSLFPERASQGMHVPPAFPANQMASPYSYPVQPSFDPSNPYNNHFCNGMWGYSDPYHGYQFGYNTQQPLFVYGAAGISLLNNLANTVNAWRAIFNESE